MIQPNELKKYLQKHFGYDSFREGQQEIISDILNGNDVFGILPTGTGKSICYQLPAKLLDGLTIVISPLVSLMMDQVKELKSIHYKGVQALNSFVNKKERQDILDHIHHIKLLYVSPELIQNQDVLQRLQKVNICLFVIDEAHCISQWGHEFRPDYLKLGEMIEQLNCRSVLALSATATAQVKEDVFAVLNRNRFVEHIYPMDRENIALYIEAVEHDQAKIDTIVFWLKKFHVPSLIYFSSRVVAEEVCMKLRTELHDRNIAYYHGGMEQMDRIMIQQQFMNEQLDIICCTSAFGMGINKRNIRLVIHYHFPKQKESFIQEIGRAGRDGEASVSLLLFNEQDTQLANFLVDRELPSENELKAIFQILHHLSKINGQLPKNEVEAANLLQLNEIQWRFMYYQFEKHGMIKLGQILYEQEVWQRAYQEILRYITDRNMYKVNKLTEMIDWIHETTCLRESLYKSFQEVVKQPEYNCCKNCGFHIDLWKPGQVTSEKRVIEQTWKQKLNRILHNRETL